MMNDIPRPASPSSANQRPQVYRPDELNPDLANMAMARDTAKKWPTPTIVNSKFTVYYGIWSALNHREPSYDAAGKVIDPGNPTFYDCSFRLAVYNGAGVQSVNKDGKLFNSLFALWMKPQYIIQGMPMLSGDMQDKPGIIRSMINRITGRGNETQQGNNS